MVKRSKNKPKKIQLKSPAENEINKPLVAIGDLTKKTDVGYKRKLKRRDIRDDFLLLSKNGAPNTQQIADFIVKYGDSLDLMEDILSPYKVSEDLHAQVIWKFLSGRSDSVLDAEILKSQLITERKDELKKLLPSPVKILVPISEDGPRFEAINSEFLNRTVRKHLSGHYSPVNVRLDYLFRSTGEHVIYLAFSDDLEIPYSVMLDFDQQPLPEMLSKACDLIKLETETNGQDVINFLQTKLDSESPSDILNYFPVMENILMTAHTYGYWKSPWIQSIYVEWENRYKEFVLNQEIEKIAERLYEINGVEHWIPDHLDDDKFNINVLKEIGMGIIKADATLSEYPLQLIVSDENINKEKLEIDVLLSGAHVGKIDLLRTATFLPAAIRDEIRGMVTNNLGRLKSAQTDLMLFEVANKEIEIGIHITDEHNRPDYHSQSECLGGICRVLLDKGKISSAQFKRALTCYYASRGPELLEDNPIASRQYFLLFYRMFYKEGMNDQIKLLRNAEYDILANFIATYLDDQTKKRPIRFTDIKCPSDLLSQRPLIFRLVQLYTESPKQSFKALFELYLIETNFVRNLLKNIQQRLGRKIERYDLENLRPDSNALIQELVEFLLSDLSEISSAYKINDLLGFSFSILDCTDIAKTVLGEFEMLIESARAFSATKDAVQKSNLYSMVDRGSLQCNEVVNQLANQLRVYSDKMKKASRITRFLEEIKNDINILHREFFSSARLEVQIDNVTIPNGQESPVELIIINSESGHASRVHIKIDTNSSYRAERYEIPIPPFFAREERPEIIKITPLSDIGFELSGRIVYSDQESMKRPGENTKFAKFRKTVTVSNPEQFHAFQSPYITGLAVYDSDMFFGRRKEMEEIIRFLRGTSQDRVLAVHGERRIGKTSLLIQLQHGDPKILQIEGLDELQRNYVIVYVSFELFQESHSTWEIYYKIYKSLSEIKELRDANIKVFTMESFPKEGSHFILENYLVDVIAYLSTKEKRLLLLFDEFDNLIRIDGENRGVFGFMREFIMKHALEVSFIFVGQTVTMVKEMSDKTKRLFSLPVPKKILRLGESEAYELIDKPMKKVEPRFEWSEGGIRKIIHYTDGNPYLIQVLCNYVVQLLISGKRLHVTMNDVNMAIHDTVIEYNGVLKYALSDILIDSRLNINAKIVLAALASLIGEENYENRWVSSDAISQKISGIPSRFGIQLLTSLLNDLCDSSILLQMTSRNEVAHFAFRLPLLRLYVNTHLNLRDLLKEGEYLIMGKED